MAVKGKSRAEILDAFERRIHHAEDVEFRTALTEVHRIALLRLREL
jgi:2-oxo-4-hydroxy-4-carboxy-5-ureidoimidazoline decarboxylase